MIRKQGRTVELTDAEYHALARLHAAGGRLGPAERERLEREANGPANLSELLQANGLDRPENWAAVRLLPSDVPADQLPPDAAAGPKRIYFEITRRCNRACQTCFNNSHHALPGELTHDEILDVNRQAYELGVFEIRYTGGECTTVPGFADVVADARRRGIYVSIGTNGVYSDEQLEWIPYCGIDWFIISLDGDRETHEKVRGSDTFDRVLRTLAALAGLPSVRVRVNMTVARHNVAAIEAVARVASEHRVGSLNLIPLRPYGRAAKTMTPLLFDGAGYYDYLREVRRLRGLFPDVEFITAMNLDDPRPRGRQAPDLRRPFRRGGGASPVHIRARTVPRSSPVRRAERSGAPGGRAVS